jgi:eukaryotic-like serine/threonine-protein kinase
MREGGSVGKTGERLGVVPMPSLSVALWGMTAQAAPSSGLPLPAGLPAGSAEALAFLFVTLYLTRGLPRLSSHRGFAATLLLLALLLAAALAGLATTPLLAAAALLLLGHLLWFARRRAGIGGLATGPAAALRLHALALHGQGELDRAFALFRQCPGEAGLSENLYHLALDYERRRDFAKAALVYRHLLDRDPDFRDARARLAHAGPAQAADKNGDGAGALRRLGCYRLERALGKGAMGVVYLGRNETDGSAVAIKTMALAQEFDAAELADVKARFFREAESAGRLAHPNIVKLHEAGEEGGLAYIVFEFLAGSDLAAHTRPGHLLPLAKVLGIAIQIAEALDHAHRQGIVHRDIKPANIMYVAATGLVKVTDFGIARITDSSRTRTGMVLGTPSYMSPEQLLGSKVDGRSDLFSLGVMLYQLASGHLPFVGESMVQLMNKIAHEAPPDIRSHDPQLPACLAAIIDKALAKNAAGRYPTGGSMAADLKQCQTSFSGGKA